jgi:hypothetical protein
MRLPEVTLQFEVENVMRIQPMKPIVLRSATAFGLDAVLYAVVGGTVYPVTPGAARSLGDLVVVTSRHGESMDWDKLVTELKSA